MIKPHVKNMISRGSVGPVDLGFMSHMRRNNAHLKSQNLNLVRRELANHQFSVMEYSNHLLNHLIRLEEKNNNNLFKPSLSTFESQPQINSKMRFLIFDFLMCCHTRLGLSTPTLFLCFNILDRYTSKYIVKSSNYQLLALTALWISSKYWDSKNRIASLKFLQRLCCKQYSTQQFKEMELHLLKSLNWSLCQFATADSFIDMLLFLKDNKNVSPSVLHDNRFDIDEIKFGSVMLCELASFDIELSFNCTASQIVLATITLTTLALKFDELNEWENFQSHSNDANLIRVCNSLLELVLKTESLPSSFKFKYGVNNEGKSTSEKILKALHHYFIQLQVEEFYRSQEYLPSNGLSALSSGVDEDFTSNDKSNDINDDNERIKDDESSGRGRAAGQPYQHSFAYNTYTLASSNSARTPPVITSSSASPFASPFMAHELFTTSNTPDSLPTPSCDKSLLSFSRSTTTINNPALVPLTPTTPTLLQNQMKLGAIKRRSMANIHSRNSATQFQSRTEIPTGFVKGHRKRASSTMDIDFFEDDVAIKR